MKKILLIMLSLVILSGCSGKSTIATESDNGIKIFLDGNQLVFKEYYPYIDDNKVLQFPLDNIESVFNMVVNWDNEKLTAFISKDNKKISVRIGDNNLIMDGKSIAMSSIVYEINGEVFVPIQSILKAFDYELNWDSENKKLDIKTPHDKAETGNRTFNFACKLADKFESDYIFSPISIKLSLAMLANGVDDDTKKQIENVLEIKNLSEYNKYVENYLLGIKNSDDFKINFGNSIWLNEDIAKGASLKNDFVSLLDNYFGGFVSKVNNKNAVDLINNWVMEHTENKIQNAVNSSDFLLSLINTVYFSGQWQLPFSAENNLQDNFKCKNGEDKKIEFMEGKEHYFYYEDNFYKMISIPYKHSDLSMYIVLPKAKEFSLKQIRFDNLEKRYVQVRLPKFKKEFSMNDNLKNVLIELGMSKVFTGFNSDKMFDNLNSNIKCDNIVHNAFINLNEYGTEAAAATLIMINKMALPIESEVVKFYADRPFKYFVRDNLNGEIIFMGDFSCVD